MSVARTEPEPAQLAQSILRRKRRISRYVKRQLLALLVVFMVIAGGIFMLATTDRTISAAQPRRSAPAVEP